MEYKIINQDDTVQIQIHDDVTFDDHNNFRSVIENVSGNGISQCIVDMRNVSYIDSAGLGMLLLLHEEASKTNVSVTIYPGDGQVARMMELAKFDLMFNFASGKPKQ